MTVSPSRQLQWNALTDRFAGTVWKVVRRHGLEVEQAADVCLLTWMRLADYIPELDPAQIQDWLEHTSEREATRMDSLQAIFSSS
jgi:hypothetical protein